MATSFFCYKKVMQAFVLLIAAAAVQHSPLEASGERVHTASEVQTTAVTKTVEVMATGYTAGFESTGKRPGHKQYGITYSGVKVRRDQVSTIAADPAVFPIGTLLHIPGYGYGVVADTGSAIKGKHIDLYFETIEEVYKQWGKKKVKVEVLRLGTGKLSQAWLNNINQAVEAGKAIPQTYLES